MAGRAAQDSRHLGRGEHLGLEVSSAHDSPVRTVRRPPRISRPTSMRTGRLIAKVRRPVPGQVHPSVTGEPPARRRRIVRDFLGRRRVMDKIVQVPLPPTFPRRDAGSSQMQISFVRPEPLRVTPRQPSTFAVPPDPTCSPAAIPLPQHPAMIDTDLQFPPVAETSRGLPGSRSGRASEYRNRTESGACDRASCRPTVLHYLFMPATWPRTRPGMAGIAIDPRSKLGAGHEVGKGCQFAPPAQTASLCRSSRPVVGSGTGDDGHMGSAVEGSGVRTKVSQRERHRDRDVG